MRIAILIIIGAGLFACNPNEEKIKVLQKRIDSLEIKLSNTYAPGFGEFMSSVQIHHNKLWFAGINENWQLADFEIHEIREAVDAIPKFEAARIESKKIGLIYPALDSMDSAIKQRNISDFKNGFTLLTNTCNNCHKATNFEFNIVKVPDNPPFSNQNFKLTIDTN